MGVYLIASWWGDPTNWLSAGKAALGLGFVIFVHELGHFLVAKACGVKCEKFYVGFDVPIKIGPLKLPQALFRKQVGETEYGIGIIPLGGYVKMLGQDDNPGNAEAEAQRMMIKTTTPDGQEVMQLDPRSYPAKSVPQRMAIISAGVIMNLIFAVIFATAAYLMGLKYTPTIIGSVVPGNPAWKAGLTPGDKLVQLGPNEPYDDQLRFRDLKYKVIEIGSGNATEMLFRHADGTEEWLSLTPNMPFQAQKKSGMPTIGILSQLSNTVAKRRFDFDSATTTVKLAEGTQIVGARVNDADYVIEDGLALQQVLLQNPSSQVTLTTQAPPDKESGARAKPATVVLAASAVRTLGMSTGMGKIVAIRANSPAEQSGFREGDVLAAINGEPISDTFWLDNKLRAHIGNEVTVTVKRGPEQLVEFRVTPTLPTTDGIPIQAGGVTSIESLGVAYEVDNIVASVEPSGPADIAGVAPGDILVAARFVANETDNDTQKLIKEIRFETDTEFDGDENGWAFFVTNLLQSAPLAANVQLTYQRDGKQETAVLTPADAVGVFHPDRSLGLDVASKIRKAASLGEAVTLGVRETKEGIMQVFFMLSRLKDLYRNVGGPGMIAIVATSEASEGFPRLLTFLTLLSANLAVLNFLPIPVLDGGHMMFLIYEGVVGKPVNERVAFGLTMLGLSFILGLMVFVIGMDVYRFAGFAG